MTELYERERTIKIENDIASLFAVKHGLEWERNPEPHAVPDHFFFGYDHSGLGDPYMLVSETKRRYYNFGQKYGDFYIDLSKVTKIRKFTPADMLFIIGFNDVYASVNVGKIGPYLIDWNGRKDRGDRYDQDILAHFRWSDFKVQGPKDYE